MDSSNVLLHASPLHSLKLSTSSSLLYTLYLQAFSFFACIILQCIYFRWYVCVACILGVICNISGFYGIKKKHTVSLIVFYLGQYLGLIAILAGAMWAFYSIAYFEEDCGARPNDCTPLPVLGIAAASCPLLFLLFMFGAIYCKRLLNIMEAIALNAPLKGAMNMDPIVDTSYTLYRENST